MSAMYSNPFAGKRVLQSIRDEGKKMSRPFDSWERIVRSRLVRARLLTAFFLFVSIYGLSFHSIARAAVPLRERISIDADWRFQKGDPSGAEGRLAYEKIKDWVTATGNEFVMGASAVEQKRPTGNLGDDISYTRSNFDDSNWRQLNLPHDWGIEGPFNQDYPGETGKLPWWGVGWYRKHFVIPATDKGRHLSLEVDGAMAYATVWLNGKFVGGWPYGYASFELDLTPYIEFGAENVLAIRLDNPPDSSRWYPGGGIYRNVWLVKTSPIHIGHWGTYVTTPEVSASAATVNIKATLANETATPVNLLVKTQIFELNSESQRVGAPLASSPPQNIKV